MKVQDDPTPTLSLYKNEYCWHQHSESIEISEKELRDQKLRHKKEKKKQSCFTALSFSRTNARHLATNIQCQI